MGPWPTWFSGRCSWFLPMADGWNEVIFKSFWTLTSIPLFCQAVHLWCSHHELARGVKLKKVIFKDAELKCWVSQIPLHWQVWEGQNIQPLAKHTFLEGHMRFWWVCETIWSAGFPRKVTPVHPQNKVLTNSCSFSTSEENILWLMVAGVSAWSTLYV